MHDLAQVARIDIAPRVPLARQRIGEERGEAIIFVGLDDIADAERI